MAKTKKKPRKPPSVSKRAADLVDAHRGMAEGVAVASEYASNAREEQTARRNLDEAEDDLLRYISRLERRAAAKKIPPRKPLEGDLKEAICNFGLVGQELANAHQRGSAKDVQLVGADYMAKRADVLMRVGSLVRSLQLIVAFNAEPPEVFAAFAKDTARQALGATEP